MFIKHFILCHRYNLHTFYLDSSFHLLLAGLFSCNWWDPTFPTSWHSCEHRASIRGSASLFCKLTFMSSIDLSSHLHVITLHLPLHLHRVSHNYTSWLLKAIRVEPGICLQVHYHHLHHHHHHHHHHQVGMELDPDQMELWNSYTEENREKCFWLFLNTFVEKWEKQVMMAMNRMVMMMVVVAMRIVHQFLPSSCKLDFPLNL